MLIVFMLGVAFFYCLAEFRYMECRYTECRYAEYHVPLCYSANLPL
jgi:hypothetical protein